MRYDPGTCSECGSDPIDPRHIGLAPPLCSDCVADGLTNRPWLTWCVRCERVHETPEEALDASASCYCATCRSDELADRLYVAFDEPKSNPKGRAA